jgi:hypothetical protein
MNIEELIKLLNKHERLFQIQKQVTGAVWSNASRGILLARGRLLEIRSLKRAINDSR